MFEAALELVSRGAGWRDLPDLVRHELWLHAVSQRRRLLKDFQTRLSLVRNVWRLWRGVPDLVSSSSDEALAPDSSSSSDEEPPPRVRYIDDATSWSPNRGINYLNNIEYQNRNELLLHARVGRGSTPSVPRATPIRDGVSPPWAAASLHAYTASFSQWRYYDIARAQPPITLRRIRDDVAEVD